MRKIIVGILSLLYISTATGATIHLHYCMGKMINWGFWKNTSKTCGGCGMETSDANDNNCCKDETTFVKNDNDQKTPETGLQMMQFLAFSLPVPFFKIVSSGFSSVTEKSPLSNAPPRSKCVAVYVLNRTFLI